MPMGEVPNIPVPDPTPSAADAMQNRPPPSGPPGEGGAEGAPPAATEGDDVPRNELGCGPTRFWAGAVKDKDTISSVAPLILIRSKWILPYRCGVFRQKSAVFGFECTKPGAFGDVPVDLGSVWLFAFIDTDGNGPSEGDPQGRTDDFEINTSDVSGLTVPIRIGAVVQEAFELKPPVAAAGHPVQLRPQSIPT